MSGVGHGSGLGLDGADAPVCRIIDSSCVDGPGNRSVVFFQGCNFDCTYCHNPETINLCDDCGICIGSCPSGALALLDGVVVWTESLCTGCDTCIRVCPISASPKVTRYGVEELARRLEANRPFIRGVTISGGECMLHVDFLERLCSRLAGTIGTILFDSNGSVDFAQHERLLDNCDGVMLDVKCFDEDQHLALTGASNRMVLKNVVYLAQHGKLAELRTVIIPGFLPNAETVLQTAKLVSPYIPEGQVIPYKLIRFRPNGVRESAKDLPIPSDVQMVELQQLLVPYPRLRAVVV